MAKSAVDVAYNALHEMISTQKLSAGQQLVESSIAEMLGVSRTPVREAIRRLQQDGLVELIPNKGCFLKKLTFSEMADGYEIIAHLCAMACVHLAQDYAHLDESDVQMLYKQLKIMKALCKSEKKREWMEQDIAFHKLLIEMTGIKQLLITYSTLTLYVNQVLWLVTPLFVDINASTKEHEQLLKLISAGNEEVLLFALQHHLKTVNIIRKLQGLSANELSIL